MRVGDEAQRWLEQAQDDLRWATHLADAGAYNLACFLSQQVADKALKALLYNQGEELVFGHSVKELCEKAAASIPEMAERCRRWGFLDGFYVPTRYPNALPGSIPARVYDEQAAQLTLGLATEVIDFVRQRIAGP